MNVKQLEQLRWYRLFVIHLKFEFVLLRSYVEELAKQVSSNCPFQAKMAQKILGKEKKPKKEKAKKKKKSKNKKETSASSSSSQPSSAAPEPELSPEELQLQLGLRQKDVKLNSAKMIRYEDMAPEAWN